MGGLISSGLYVLLSVLIFNLFVFVYGFIGPPINAYLIEMIFNVKDGFLAYVDPYFLKVILLSIGVVIFKFFLNLLLKFLDKNE